MIRLIDLLESDANISVTISVKDLRAFFEEVAEEVYRQRKAMDEYDGTLNQKEVCDYLGVSKATLYRWEKIGYLLPCSRVGNRPMYRKSTVENLKQGDTATE